MIGILLANRYKIVEKIGGGGMADVFRAIDEVLQEEVAVKVLRQQYVHDDDFVKRFRREAHSVASLSHENVVKIFDIGEEKEIYYIVMEYVKGSTLKEVIQRKGKLPIKEALKIAEQIALALDHAHQHHIIHRDIKPHNILIGNQGQVKVTDFGIARAVSSATITQTGSVLGSVHYLSPEQARGGWTDEKTDLYSLGVVLYEMITGSLPFSGDSPISVALKHLQENFIYPRELDPSIPQSVENIILRALMKDPLKRYASAEEMFKDIKTALDPKRIHEPRILLETDVFDDDEENTITIPAMKEFNANDAYSTQSRKNKKRSLRPKLVPILTIFFLLLLGVFGFQYISSKLVVPEIEAPLLEGKSKEDAIKLLQELNLTYKIEEKTDPVVEKGKVIKQEPYPGETMKTSQSITLYISLGKEKVAMPNLLNKQQRQAKIFLQQLGFNENHIEIKKEFNNEVPSGEVFKQEPNAEEMVVPDEQKVILFISEGKEQLKMPNLIGRDEAEAVAMVTAIGLVPRVQKDYSYQQPEGKVYRQFPFDPNQEVTAGDQVDIYVSLGYPKELKSIYSDLLVDLEEDESAEITIILRDARGKDVIWKKETITGPKFYDNIELLLLPDQQGTINVYKNGKLVKMKTVQYY
ncbi:Stk1 family PASTA domain-containing Ser/Thr kinase [Tepidibacillus infernus]|uniref:Stk1 family PASTA domain-containing Ser/Thr kinase n=1 Tax=Tepidibacillus TaxID=1494427 RepID=UPI0008590E19|nr:Stk1 family PASTA domain-containing Ser/Thr kinase [Tepidibacillus sp. HK-1]GBF12191.1 serine/threonine-protein kinase PrkC [Tepidibacillus sp. HK-1]